MREERENKDDKRKREKKRREKLVVRRDYFRREIETYLNFFFNSF